MQQYCLNARATDQPAQLEAAPICEGGTYLDSVDGMMCKEVPEELHKVFGLYQYP